MPRNSGENHRFYRGKFEVDFRSVIREKHFFGAVFYLPPRFGWTSASHSPLTHIPTPPRAANGSGVVQPDFDLDARAPATALDSSFDTEVAEEVPEVTGAEVTEVVSCPVVCAAVELAVLLAG